MTAQASPTVRFRRAIDTGNVLGALAAAAEISHLPLADALSLCRLLARTGDDRYPRAAARWLARLEAETGATLSELTMAAGLLAQLRDEPGSPLAIETLERLALSRPARRTA